MAARETTGLAALAAAIRADPRARAALARIAADPKRLTRDLAWVRTLTKRYPPDPPRTSRLTLKQERFCQEYVLDLNGAAAARRAGYSKASAKQIARELHATGKVRRRIVLLLQRRGAADLPVAKRYGRRYRPESLPD